jgi:DNA-binding XRE family transcriptional regulator
MTTRFTSPNTPTPEALRSQRAAAGHTQAQAAHLVHTSERAWQAWEAGDRTMHPGMWELYRIKCAMGGTEPAKNAENEKNVLYAQKA